MPDKQIIELARKSFRDCRLSTTTPLVEILHGILALGDSLQIDSNKGSTIRAADFVFNQKDYFKKFGIKTIAFDRMGYPTIPANLRPRCGIQDHTDQFLFFCSQIGVSLEREISAPNGKKFPLRELLEKSRKDCTIYQNAEFTIPAFVHYLEPPYEWNNRFGMKITLRDIISMSLRRHIGKGTCWGTHLLYGLSYAIQHFRKTEPQDTLLVKNIEDYLEESIRKAKTLQSPQGTLFPFVKFQISSGEEKDAVFFICATGHMLEWISFYSPPERLCKEWTRKAARLLAIQMILAPREDFLDYASMAHAYRALSFYAEKCCNHLQ